MEIINEYGLDFVRPPTTPRASRRQLAAPRRTGRQLACSSAVFRSKYAAKRCQQPGQLPPTKSTRPTALSTPTSPADRRRCRRVRGPWWLATLRTTCAAPVSGWSKRPSSSPTRARTTRTTSRCTPLGADWHEGKRSQYLNNMYPSSREELIEVAASKISSCGCRSSSPSRTSARSRTSRRCDVRAHDDLRSGAAAHRAVEPCQGLPGRSCRRHQRVKPDSKLAESQLANGSWKTHLERAAQR